MLSITYILVFAKGTSIAEFRDSEFRSEPKYIFSYFRISKFNIPSNHTVKFLDPTATVVENESL